MIAALMCGGKGFRMHDASGIEKPLQRVKDSPMIDWAMKALIDSQMFEKIVAITSLNTPDTSSFINHFCRTCADPIEVMETTGHGFSQDLSAVVSTLKPARVFVVPVDLPLLKANTIQRVIARCPVWIPCTSILLEKRFVENLGITPSVVVHSEKDTLYCHSGISVIDSSQFEVGSVLTEYYIVMNEIEIALNVNTKRELELAKHIFEEEL